MGHSLLGQMFLQTKTCAIVNSLFLKEEANSDFLESFAPLEFLHLERSILQKSNAVKSSESLMILSYTFFLSPFDFIFSLIRNFLMFQNIVVSILLD
jgi:hypothetical protein